MSRTLALASIAIGATACHKAEPRAITGLSSDLAPIVSGNNAFSWDMLRTVADMDGGNLFFSPFSMVACLSMVYGGANGETEAQLATAMSVPEGGEANWHAHLGALLADLTGEHHRPYTLYSANRVWGRQGFPFEADYLALLDGSYLAPLNEADFVSDPEAVRAEINDWVADQTRDRIPELFESGDITVETVLALVNAIYFKANWLTSFDKGETSDQPFTLVDGASVSVPMMNGEGTHLAGRSDDGTEVLQLPYEGEELSLVVLVPAEAAGIGALVDSLDDATVTDHLARVMEREAFSVTMPSFEMSYDLPFDEAMQALGIVDAFDPGLADFSGIVDPTVDQIWIGAARHKAFVRVDEEGTEAAAATGIAMRNDSDTTDAFTAIRVDRPFVYLIQDDLTGTVLFVGLMMDPSGAPLAD